ncbi:MAG: hypothetical protein ACOX6I_10040 [Syntrophomonadaceae bacterium]|jgi:hypothetical protein
MAEKAILIEKLKEMAPQGKLSCTKARQLAREMQVKPQEIGQLCDELKIKIFACELGCF